MTMTPVRATRLYLAADAYDKKHAELARMLRRARAAAINPAQSREAFLLEVEMDELAEEIHELEAGRPPVAPTTGRQSRPHI